MATITTLEQLADYINNHEDWRLETETIIKANGWESDLHTNYGICHCGSARVEFDENCIARVI